MSAGGSPQIAASFAMKSLGAAVTGYAPLGEARRSDAVLAGRGFFHAPGPHLSVVGNGAAMARFQVIRASKQLDELASVIGRGGVVRLCEALGGVRTYVPRTIGANHAIAAAIGTERAALLAEHYHGTTLDLPKAHLQRQRALQLLESGNMTVREVALQTGFTERHLYNLSQKPKRTADRVPGQR